MASPRIRVLPSSQYPHGASLPSPPRSRPMKPSKLCKIAVLGDVNSGKSSLIQKFVHREYATKATSTRSNNGSPENNRAANSNNDGYSAASSLHDTSLGTNLLSLPSTLRTAVNTLDSSGESYEYSKKDVTLYHDGHEICVRVQLWDVNLNLSADDNLDAADVAHGTHHHDNRRSIISLLDKCHVFVLAIRVPSRSPTGSNAVNNLSSANSVASASHYSILGDWPELDLVEQRIQAWSKFLVDYNINDFTGRASTFRCISIVLTHADEIISTYSPRNWMDLSSRMEKNCSADFLEWRLCCCHVDRTDGEMDSSYSIEAKAGNKILKRIQLEQNNMIEDMQDAVELTFIRLIQSFLDWD